jgi:hypothetical protein
MLVEHTLGPQVSANEATRVIDMTEAFLNLAKSDDELAHALGHELGHIFAEHRREQRSQHRHTRCHVYATRSYGVPVVPAARIPVPCYTSGPCFEYVSRTITHTRA